ncbi:MAG: helix-turn-helix transcriptional regulator, partial [Phycisphaerae bacterium]|nr:helix-turn-helix transcriptional regulator [Phycisphaerae bacterium]
TQIAERVGVSRRTVWRIANGQSRPDLQTKIADTVEGIRQATIRLAARWMKPLLQKQIEVALAGEGETARKAREFLLKTFLLALPPRAEKREPRRENNEPLESPARFNSLMELSPELQGRMSEELDLSRPNAPPDPASDPAPSAPAQDDFVSDAEGKKENEEKKEDEGKKDKDDKDDKKVKKPFDPFAEYVDGPHGTKVHVHALALEREYLAELEANKHKRPRRYVKRAPNKYHFP